MSTDTILHWLLRTSIEASALILAVLVIRRVMGSRLTPAWRVTLWSVVALKLVLPASLPTVGFGTLWPHLDRVAVTDGSRGFQPTVGTPMNHTSRSDDGTRLTSSSTQPGSGVATRYESANLADRGLKPTAAFLDYSAIICGVWMIGVIALLGIALVKDSRFRQKLSRLPINRDRRLTIHVHDAALIVGLRHAPRVLITEASTVPSVSGLMSPVLLMPCDWDSQFEEAELDAILRHELLHLKHHDLWWNWCATLVNTLHWFNPLVWLVVARCQEDRELRCDERALSIASSDERIAYGRTLLRLAEQFMTPPAIAGVAPCVRNHPLLRQRIHMITNPSSHRPWFHALCTLALGVLVMVSFGSARAQEEKPNRTREGERSTSPETTAPRQGGEQRSTVRKGEADGMKRRGEGDGAGKNGARDGEGMKKSAEGDGARKTGVRDGEGGEKRGARDGEGMKKSAEGDGARKTGARDGEGTKKSAEGEGSRKAGLRDGDGARKREGAGDRAGASGEKIEVNFPNSPLSGVFAFYTKLTGNDVLRSTETDRVAVKIISSRSLSASEAIAFIEASLTMNGYGLVQTSDDNVVKCVKTDDVGSSEVVTRAIVMHVTDGGATIIINGEKIPHARLRGHLSEFLPAHRGDDVSIEADDDVPFKSVADVLDAARDNGAKKARLTTRKGGDQ